MTNTALIAAVLAAAATTPAFAVEGPTPARAGTAPIQVMLCDIDALSQPAFRRVDGARPVFVTADEVVAARAARVRWETPRCMTAVQHQRLINRLDLRAGPRASL